jgi:hypothetical protein
MGGKLNISVSCHSSIRVNLDMNSPRVEWREEVVNVVLGGFVGQPPRVDAVASGAVHRERAISVSVVIHS